jgi:MFS family permease
LAIHESEAVDSPEKNLAVKQNKSVFGTPLEIRRH